MPSSTGLPGGGRTGKKMMDYASPDGRFMQSTKALLSTGFQVTWFDRRPASNHPFNTGIPAVINGTPTCGCCAGKVIV